MKELFHKLFDKSFLKFLVVGVINTLVGNGIMFCLYNLAGWGVWLSSAVGYVLGSVVSFFLNRHFTFQDTEKGWRPVARFTLNILVCYLVAYGAAQPLARLIFANLDEKVRDNLAMLAGMCLFTLLNYFGQKFFAFRKKS